jgi:ATP-dependent DNA ligase
VFDVLEAGGTDLRAYPYRVRRAVLQQCSTG